MPKEKLKEMFLTKENLKDLKELGIEKDEAEISLGYISFEDS